MEREVVEQLLTLNREFYSLFADEFSDTRYQPQPGFSRLAAFIPQQCRSLLDVGCGNGRLGRYLMEEGHIQKYTGVDSSSNLLEIARQTIDGDFWLRELSEEGCLNELGFFDSLCCLATLQHIPGKDNREKLVQEFAGHVNEDGTIILSTWQFPESKRQMKKVIDWSATSLSDQDIEDGDYLLTWGTSGTALRYVAHIDSHEIATMAQSAGLRVKDHFRSDGKEGDLNLYSILGK